MDFKHSKILYALISFVAHITINAQVGLTVSPPRVYFEMSPGQLNSESITVTNESKSKTLDLMVSLEDWEYDDFGNNISAEAGTLDNSCSSWINFTADDTFFSLEPGEKKEVTVNMSFPEDYDASIPVRTTMLYVTQINPIDQENEDGVNIKISVRSGVKVYVRTNLPSDKELEVTDMKFDKDNRALKLSFENKGNIWADGKVSTELLNTKNGEQHILDILTFYTLPGDKREVYIILPEDFEKGNYIATSIIDYGDDAQLEAAELKFSYE